VAIFTSHIEESIYARIIFHKRPRIYNDILKKDPKQIIALCWNSIASSHQQGTRSLVYVLWEACKKTYNVKWQATFVTVAQYNLLEELCRKHVIAICNLCVSIVWSKYTAEFPNEDTTSQNNCHNIANEMPIQINSELKVLVQKSYLLQVILFQRKRVQIRINENTMYNAIV
jgi:hypothetical protein